MSARDKQREVDYGQHKSGPLRPMKADSKSQLYPSYRALLTVNADGVKGQQVPEKGSGVNACV